jgi:hypothetical protein
MRMPDAMVMVWNPDQPISGMPLGSFPVARELSAEMSRCGVTSIAYADVKALGRKLRFAPSEVSQLWRDGYLVPTGTLTPERLLR